MNLQMDEKRKGKLISFSIAGREEELDRVGDRRRGRHNYFLDLRQSELGHIVSQPLVVVQHQKHSQALGLNDPGERRTGADTVLYEESPLWGHFDVVVTAGRALQLAGQTPGQPWLGAWPGGGAVEVSVLGGGLPGHEVSVTIISQYQL